MQNEPPAGRRPQQRKNHTLTRIRLERFTAFEHLDLNLSPGINVFIGANGTGKTHLLKVAYSACDFNVIESDVIMPERHFREKLTRVFLPYKNDIGRLVKHSGAYREGVVEVWYGDQQFRVTVSKRGTGVGSLHNLDWPYGTIKSVFIPAKEVLANAPGFRSLYRQREIHFEETYSDIVDRAYLPALREDIDDARSRLVNCLETAVGGRVTVDPERSSSWPMATAISSLRCWRKAYASSVSFASWSATAHCQAVPSCSGTSRKRISTRGSSR